MELTDAEISGIRRTRAMKIKSAVQVRRTSDCIKAGTHHYMMVAGSVVQCMRCGASKGD